MTHMVFMKFAAGFFSPAVFQRIADEFCRLQEAMPLEILSVQVRENCISRETNMDVLIQMELRDPSVLEQYLNHSIHLEISREMNPHIVRRCSFDYME